MWIRGLIFSMVRHLAGLLLGGTILWYIAASATRHGAQAVVHVMSTEVDVTVDGQSFRIERIEDSPVVCDLRPGRHLLRMTRGDRLLYEEEFMIEPGEHSVRMAWEDPALLKRGDIGSEPVSAPVAALGPVALPPE